MYFFLIKNKLSACSLCLFYAISGEWDRFFVFPDPPFQFLKLVVIGRWIVAGFLAAKAVL